MQSQPPNRPSVVAPPASSAKEDAPFLSLVIPCYNEERRIAAGLARVRAYLDAQRYPWEIIVVDDGSEDQTLALAKRLAVGLENTKIIARLKNGGKGAALRDGMLAARGANVIFSDIDLSTPIEELPRLLKGLETHPVVIGMRRHPEARLEKHQPKVREFLGACFTALTRAILTPGIADATCGFKGFRRETAHVLFGNMRINRWAFDAEILFLARKFGFDILQLPVRWVNNEDSRVHMLRDGTRAFIDLLRVRVWDFLGYYAAGRKNAERPVR